ncbi:MAG: T9SS type A sorting domain-containing protein [Saprospirales bacterium]|nr:T9SS type A sorting domain-containing protein [Saprospirales bacterium]
MKNLYAIFALALLFVLSGNLTGQTVLFWEEFDASANGWVSEPVTPLDSSFWDWADNNWNWSADGNVGTGAFFNTMQDSTINSETAANGSMVFNADFNTTQGDPTNYPPSGPPYVQYICNLTSPNIDLSGATLPVQLEFNQNLRFLNVSSGAPGGFRVSVVWSTDGGTTWSAPADAGAGQAVNQYGNASTVITLPMTGVAGSATVKVRFTFSSDFYYWCIDDVKIVERPAHDMRVNDNWYAVAPNLFWPLDMVETFSFLADIQNLGSQPQTNVVLNITMEDEGANVVYTEDLDFGTVDVDSTVENEPFTGPGFTPNATGVYTGTYSISADSADFNPDNNSLSFEFLVTDTLFAKENGVTLTTRPSNASWDVDEPWSWAYGNYYYVPTAGNYFFGHVFFSLDVTDNPDLADENVTIRIYKWTDDNADELADPAERDPVATMIYTITGNEASDDELIAIPVTTLLGDPVPLEDDTEYIVAVEFQTDITGKTVDMGMSRAVDFGAMSLRAQLGGAPRYGSFLGVLGNLDEEPYSSLGFGTDFVPVIRVSVVETSNTKELLNAAEVLNISPNPANDFVQFDVKLKETSSQIRVELLDMTGRSLGMQAFQNTNVVNTSFNTSNLANGTYLVRIDTDFGYTTELFVVQK